MALDSHTQKRSPWEGRIFLHQTLKMTHLRIATVWFRVTYMAPQIYFGNMYIGTCLRCADSRGCESVNTGVQASARREMSYIGLAGLPVHLDRVSEAAWECGELGNGNGGLQRAPLGWLKAAGSGRARFRMACNFTRVAAGVGDASRLNH